MRPHLVCGTDARPDRGPDDLRAPVRDRAAETARHLDRLSEITPRVAVGQLTGAVGTQAALGEKGDGDPGPDDGYPGLVPVEVSNQVIARDRYAEYFMFLANVATTLDKIGFEIRTLQRARLPRWRRHSGRNRSAQGTMPHKRNRSGASRSAALPG